jgi:hypothetical protein
LDNIGSRLEEVEGRASTESHMHPPSLENWLSQIQSKLHEESSSMSSVSNVTSFGSSFTSFPKDGSRDDISLASSEEKDTEAQHPMTPPDDSSQPNTPPSEDESIPESTAYSDSSLHGSRIETPPPDEDIHVDVDEMPLSECALYV